MFVISKSHLNGPVVGCHVASGNFPLSPLSRSCRVAFPPLQFTAMPQSCFGEPLSASSTLPHPPIPPPVTFSPSSRNSLSIAVLPLFLLDIQGKPWTSIFGHLTEACTGGDCSKGAYLAGGGSVQRRKRSLAVVVDRGQATARCCWSAISDHPHCHFNVPTSFF